MCYSEMLFKMLSLVHTQLYFAFVFQCWALRRLLNSLRIWAVPRHTQKQPLLVSKQLGLMRLTFWQQRFRLAPDGTIRLCQLLRSQAPKDLRQCQLLRSQALQVPQPPHLCSRENESLSCVCTVVWLFVTRVCWEAFYIVSSNKINYQAPYGSTTPSRSACIVISLARKL
jgi:hypothetical protein